MEGLPRTPPVTHTHEYFELLANIKWIRERMKHQALINEWRKRMQEYESQVRPEWEHGDKYASRRYEGIAIATRWCIEDLQKSQEPHPCNP